MGLKETLARGQEIAEAARDLPSAQAFVRRHAASGDLRWAEVRTLTQRMQSASPERASAFFAWADAFVNAGQDPAVPIEQAS